jgi:hypothetical protein
MQSLQKILREFIKDFGIEDGTLLNAIQKNWTEIVGQPVAAHTFPDTVKGKVLTIIVDTPQWLHHLSFFKEDISEKLTSYNLDSVRFRQGRLPLGVQDTSREEKVELTDDDMRYIENTVKNVKDEELREKFVTLITHGLTRGKKNSS